MLHRGLHDLPEVWYPHAPLNPATQRPTSLPDIIFFPNIPNDYTAEELQQAQKKIILADITYTDDRDVHQRYADKCTKHEAYVQALLANHWHVELYPIVITYSGCITDSLYKMLHDGCKLSPPKIKTVLSNLHFLTSSYNWKLVTTRKVLKKQLTPTTDPQAGVG